MTTSRLGLFGAVKPDHTLEGILGAESNCGIIVAQDGSWKVFQSDPSPARAACAKTREQFEAMERKVTALALALSNDQLMAILYDVMDNTDMLTLLKDPAHAH